MVSEVDICNRTLISIHTPLITSLSEDSEQAVMCNVLYPQVRDEVLRAHFWNFAMAQATLQQSATTPLFDFSYAYELPSDYVRIRRIQNDPRYKIKGTELHTNQASALIEYVSKVTDPTKFDSMFVTALALRLGAALAYPLAGSESRAASLGAQYEKYIKEAKRADGQEGTPDSLTADLFVDSRQGFYKDWTSV